MNADRPLARREVLAGLAAGLAAAALPHQAVAATAVKGLKHHAAARGITYGCAVMASQLASSPDLAAAIIEEAAILVPEFEMKWGETDKKRGAPNYALGDQIVDFAQSNDMEVRGHAALWHINIPDWVIRDLAKPGAEAVMTDRVHAIVGHYKGRIAEWDVVNEAVEPADGIASFLRDSPLYGAGGEGYIADAFVAAHEADPKALLFYNDAGIEYSRPDNLNRRRGVLRLLTELKRRDVPIHGFGMECHLNASRDLDEAALREFLREVADLGLRISVTELDINDASLPRDILERDSLTSDHMRRFLNTVLDEPAVRTVLTWGLSDRFFWLNRERPRTDGARHRGLPLDDDMARTPLWQAIADCFDNAPSRK